MNKTEAIKILEFMAINMVGELGGLCKTNPMADVLRQKIDAIDYAQRAIRSEAERDKGCVSCDGGWGDNTVEFMRLNYTLPPSENRQRETRGVFGARATTK